MARFYRLEVRPTLFGEWSVVRFWGRIGTIGRAHLETYLTQEAAMISVDRLEQAKRRRGYVPIEGQG